MLMATDQTQCFDEKGQVIACHGTGQDGELRAGPPWPGPRFVADGPLVHDRLTSLTWPADAGILEFPLEYEEALSEISRLNREGFFGVSDWRLPGRAELFSLVSHARVNPSLPHGHLFENVFPGYYWAAETRAGFLGQAWTVHLGGARVFPGMRHRPAMAWPMRGPATAAFSGARFLAKSGVVLDRLNNLSWPDPSKMQDAPLSWQGALDAVARLNRRAHLGFSDWRLPNVRELESLVDLTARSPALAHPLAGARPGYWSSTTSVYEPRYAWALYTGDGRVGVGYKKHADFFTWPVR